MLCVSFSKTVERAVQFALGETLIVEEMAQARKVAYTDLPALGRSGVKVVTVAGEKIGANGNMSFSADAAGSDRWKLQDLQHQRQRLAEVETQLAEVAALDEADVEGARGQAAAARATVSMQHDRVQRMAKRVAGKREELAALDKLLQERAQGLLRREA